MFDDKAKNEIIKIAKYLLKTGIKKINKQFDFEDRYEILYNSLGTAIQLLFINGLNDNFCNKEMMLESVRNFIEHLYKQTELAADYCEQNIQNVDNHN
ncbi:MAG TPA: hypothetical protein VHZ76_03350 [Gammaproteobacteria bacterium]|jgi:hypothetical protein|nr:hypothetical protein [Gammaproteobacteria bacterium]